MNDFTASNGVHIVLDQAAGNTVVRVSKGGLVEEVFGTPRVAALREFFRAEEDERLGRWRWPTSPNWVCYPTRSDEVVVFDESDPATGSRTLSRGGDTWPHFRPAADAYFDAHPEPKPWHAAQVGEVWALTAGGKTKPATFRHGIAIYMDGRGVDMDKVTDGRRIWPEVTK